MPKKRGEYDIEEKKIIPVYGGTLKNIPSSCAKIVKYLNTKKKKYTI